MKIEKWRVGEITFTAQDTYTDPFMENDLSVTFTSENGTVLVRPAFWDGENVWKVRFAPTETGKWTYKTYSLNKADKGLHNIEGELECVDYTGDLEIYKRGFVKVSENKRYFVYDDGTPFYYLGDTHWLMLREPFEESNIEGIDSTFKFIVDYRLTQGFTVYQSEPIGGDCENGIHEEELRKLHDFDRKFKYIADKGLLHANAQLFFAAAIKNPKYTPEYLVKLAKMWAARYGAYPVMWTVAQEVDPDFYTHSDVDKWDIVGETLYLNDCYKHPLTGHMCNQNRCNPKTTKWGRKYFHSWFGMQPQGMVPEHYEDFYNFKPTRPIVNYETGYENLWSTDKTAYRYGYFALFNGACGYGYGAHGIWNGNVSYKEWMNYGGYIHWFTGVLLPGAKKFPIMNAFFKAFDWYNIVPHYSDKEYWSAPMHAQCASLGDHTYFVFDYCIDKSDYTLYKAENGEYTLLFFDIEQGTFEDLGNLTVTDNTAYIPLKKFNGTSVFILTKKREMFDSLPLNIQTENRESIFRFKGDKLVLKANKPCEFTVDDESIARLEGNTLIAMGKNGLVTVTAKTENETFERKFLAVRQNFDEAPTDCKEIRVAGAPEAVTAEKASFTVHPELVPENCWYQDAKLVITDNNGEKAQNVFIGKNYVVKAIFNGDINIKFVSSCGVESAAYKVTATGLGEPSLTFGGTATADDDDGNYDPRCLPMSAISGITERFSGWVSRKRCSDEDPATLTITLKQPSLINNIKVYTTDMGYTIKSFDLYVDGEGISTKIASVRDNEEIVLDFKFDKLLAEKIRVVCFQGDANGNARVDQIDAFLI